MEVMLGHRDGYCLARNNHRVYHDLDSGKMVLFPHSTDQLFGSLALFCPGLSPLFPHNYQAIRYFPFHPVARAVPDLPVIPKRRRTAPVKIHRFLTPQS